MAWIYLLLAGVFEIGWPVGFKLSQQPEYKVWAINGAIASMGMSGWLLLRTLGVGLIVGGVVILKLAH